MIPAIQIKNNLGEVNCTVSYDASASCPTFKWEGFTDLPELKKACLAMLNLVQETKASIYLSDNRLATGYTDELTPYTSTHFVPKMKELGIVRHAILFSEEVFAQISAEEFEASLAGFFKAKMFKDLEEAKAWLKG